MKLGVAQIRSETSRVGPISPPLKCDPHKYVKIRIKIGHLVWRMGVGVVAPKNTWSAHGLYFESLEKMKSEVTQNSQ